MDMETLYSSPEWLQSQKHNHPDRIILKENKWCTVRQRHLFFATPKTVHNEDKQTSLNRLCLQPHTSIIIMTEPPDRDQSTWGLVWGAGEQGTNLDANPGSSTSH